jgi:hypothetical protein
MKLEVLMLSRLLRLIGRGIVAAVLCGGAGGWAIAAPASLDDAGRRPAGDIRSAMIAGTGQVRWLEKTGFLPLVEYRGSYICPQGITTLVLWVADDRAVFNFGAHPDNPGLPSGSFSMRGSVDPAAGVMRLAPVRWMVQPQGWRMVGLDGVSDDRGRTFHGKVTGDPHCTNFWISRVSLAS